MTALGTPVRTVQVGGVALYDPPAWLSQPSFVEAGTWPFKLLVPAEQATVLPASSTSTACPCGGI